MKKYFKLIGIIELISFFIGAIMLIVKLIKNIDDTKYFFIILILFLLYIFFAPAIGLLFLSHSKSLPVNNNLINNINSQAINLENFNFNEGDFVECIDTNILAKYNINHIGKIVFVNINDELVGVEFSTPYNTHYTLSLKTNQIKKLHKKY